jgi:hypothetical protein
MSHAATCVPLLLPVVCAGAAPLNANKKIAVTSGKVEHGDGIGIAAGAGHRSNNG